MSVEVIYRDSVDQRRFMRHLAIHTYADPLCGARVGVGPLHLLHEQAQDCPGCLEKASAPLPNSASTDNDR